MRPEASARVGMTRGEEYNTVRGLLGYDPGSAAGLGLSTLHIWGCTLHSYGGGTVSVLKSTTPEEVLNL